MGKEREVMDKLTFSSEHAGMLGLGITVIESPLAITSKQFRFPRSKKKRIKKKWAKNRNHFRDEPAIYVISPHTFYGRSEREQIIAHPKCVAMMRNIGTSDEEKRWQDEWNNKWNRR